MSRRRKAQRPEEGTPQGGPPRVDELRAAVLVVAVFFAIGLPVLGGVLIYSIFDREAEPPRAAIVDQLSLTAPNPAFVEEATDALERAGYVVDYYPGEEVTVDFYRNLPRHGHELIILRAHAGRHLGADGKPTDDADLFTSEPYVRTKYVDEQRTRRLARVRFSLDESADNPAYFGIKPDFVKSSMRGEFAGTTVILMGCDVVRSQSLAEAFVQKGADAVVGWDGPVSASHTDAATLNLLQHLLDDDLPVKEAAAAAMVEVGPDPSYDSVLLSYPPGG